MQLRWGLRGKVLALSSLLLLLPLFAYQFVVEMENFLREGQQQTLLGTSSAIATALHERPSLFNEHASFLPNVTKGQDLYIHNLAQSIRLDANNEDWGVNRGFKNSYQNDPLEGQTTNTDIYTKTNTNTNNVHFNQLLGKRDGFLYAHFEVSNQHPITRAKNSTQVTDNDHLIIAMSSPEGELQRYIISVANDGWFNAYRYPQHSIYATNLTREKSIQGIWQSTKQGYNIELRMPLTLLGDKLGFQLNTASTLDSKRVDNVISTSNLLDINKLGSVLIPSPEIEQILLAMRHTRARLWVVDRHQRVIAQAGDIHQATGIWPAEATNDQDTSFWTKIEARLLSPLYALLLEQPENHFIDKNQHTTQLNNNLVKQSLDGKAATQWRLSSDKKVSILSATHPIFVHDKVVGVVIAEETNNGIITLRNQALQKMFSVLLGVIFVAGVLLFLFLSTVINRVRALRDQSEQILDNNGRLKDTFSASKHSDEIGDLSRSMADMVQRLGQYHHYVEQLSSRLSHELRTPVAVVRSSLENLSLLPCDAQQQKYITRSQQGIQRLSKILTSMSEASRIEQSLQQAEKQPIDLRTLLDSCLQGYEMVYPQSTFEKYLGEETAMINADPDFLVQMLDKIINNAVEFSISKQAIVINLVKLPSNLSYVGSKTASNKALGSPQQTDHISLSITNQGTLLSSDNNQDLFQSMVSVRPASQQHDTHLGLGLYIAKMICEYHQATLTIENNSDLTGVTVTITLPLMHS
ncbi:proteobacterial dedicated sortase system histidine kinase [Psychromonas sp. SR45-3]|uniref:proteobacterial dedicated sortase system histidine kinase n=1 Tax=Psychromonas sp. SR45-3 TaxID=2760930 RepID=UPI0015F83C13|nr:proteobacterial dedicated sortase system histidine kinase [Psychromonas sp. SR45-3]MBB1272183.1 proteobacterial dedicated sortase system histidine kinase [Psychromonas sp. SR45-3]